MNSQDTNTPMIDLRCTEQINLTELLKGVNKQTLQNLISKKRDPIVQRQPVVSIGNSSDMSHYQRSVDIERANQMLHFNIERTLQDIRAHAINPNLSLIGNQILPNQPRRSSRVGAKYKPRETRMNPLIIKPKIEKPISKKSFPMLEESIRKITQQTNDLESDPLVPQTKSSREMRLIKRKVKQITQLNTNMQCINRQHEEHESDLIFDMIGEFIESL